MKPYKKQEDFGKNNLNAGCENLYDIGYKLFDFDMGSQNILSSARPLNIIFKLHKKSSYKFSWICSYDNKQNDINYQRWTKRVGRNLYSETLIKINKNLETSLEKFVNRIITKS